MKIYSVIWSNKIEIYFYLLHRLRGQTLLKLKINFSVKWNFLKLYLESLLYTFLKL